MFKCGKCKFAKSTTANIKGSDKSLLALLKQISRQTSSRSVAANTCQTIPAPALSATDGTQHQQEPSMRFLYSVFNIVPVFLEPSFLFSLLFFFLAFWMTPGDAHVLTVENCKIAPSCDSYYPN